MKSGASPMWKRKEMGLAQKPSAQAKEELAEMGREQERMRDRWGAQTWGQQVGGRGSWVQMGVFGRDECGPETGGREEKLRQEGM